MAEFVVHGVTGSAFCRSVLATLAEKGADWRFDAVQPGSFDTPGHRRLHPFGRVPILDHRGFHLYETQAILRYLDRVLPQPLLTPATPQLAARMDQLLGITDAYLFGDCASVLVQQRIIGPQLTDTPADEAAVAAVLPRADLVFGELSRWLGPRQWFVGEAITLADIHVAALLDLLVMTPEWPRLVAGRGNLVAHLERMQDRPSFARTTMARLFTLAA
ncbi:glutathione S-transferase [alpha proteobacterium AAP81b]|nr:glutathione S-transferase [alpha proteobacterium AAP81b]